MHIAESTETPMNRRTLLTSAGVAAVGAALASGVASAQDAGHGAHAGSHPNGKLIAATGHCVAMGDICLDHCIASLGTGETMMKDCAELVIDSIATCTALGKLAANKSPHVAALAAVAQKVCEDCAAECKRHASHSEECKACYDACEACIAECKTAAGA